MLLIIAGCMPVKPQVALQPTPPPILLLEQTTSSIEPHTPNTAALGRHDDIWQRVRDNYQLDNTIDNRRIDVQLNWYKSHQRYLNRVSQRATRYMFFIMQQIEVRNIPAEIALLPIVESAFEPFAYSHGRASGVWQFIPSTGRMYGLQQDWWFDGRRDIRHSTIAALKFLRGLSREFKGDWMLALAAYNSGAGTVRKAIRKNKKLGLPVDFWSLSLPRETKAYVPKLLALARLVGDPGKYGVTLPKIDNTPYFAVIKTGSQMDLSQAAQMADVDLEEIYKLNPQYNQWSSNPNGPHEILVPVAKQALFRENLKKLPANQRIKWQRYKVVAGDSLSTISSKFHTTTEAIKQVNPLRGNTIKVNDMLLIPTAFKKLSSYTYSADNRLSKKQKRTRGPKGSTRIQHQVKAGDSFWSLAKTHKVSTMSIARWNGMAPKDTLRPGQTLIIWSKLQLAKADREVIRKIHYRVRNGDSLHRIADKFNVKVHDIQRWNPSSKKKYLQPGDKLVLYVDVTRAS
ncbi:MAG: LysM peptidoglycan-binding domain-containing protein [Bermanella sp.]